MYSTSLKTWARAVAVDGIFIGALVAGVIYHIPYALEVSVFFMWWISIFGLVFGLIIAVLPGISQAAIESLKEQLEWLPPESEKAEEPAAKIAKAEEGAAKLWSVNMVNRLAVSNTYLTYHWLTDIAVWVLLIVAGHPILATFTSVVGGTVIMSVIVLTIFLSGGLEGHSFPGVDSWWMYLGGPAGAGITICAASSVRRLGTFRLALAMVSGQMTTALVVDFFSDVPISPATVISAATVVLATILASVKPKSRGAASA